MSVTAKLVEIWIWYAFVMLGVASRFISKRIVTKSWLLQLDDWLMFLAVCFFTASLVIDTEAIIWNDRLEDDPNMADRDDVFSMVRLFIIIYDHFTLTVLWLCKAGLLAVFWQKLQKIRDNVMIKLVSIYTASSYLYIIIAFAVVWCRPASEYLEEDASYDECRRPTGHIISLAVTDISTNIFLVALAILYFYRIGFMVKGIYTYVLIIFASAAMAITVVNRIDTITDDDLDLLLYNVRECALAMTVVNLVATRPLWQWLTNHRPGRRVSESSRPNSWQRSWRPSPRLPSARDDVRELANAEAQWRDMPPTTAASTAATTAAPSRSLSKVKPRDEKEGEDDDDPLDILPLESNTVSRDRSRSRDQREMERQRRYTESPAEMQMGTMSSMSTRSWLNMDGD